MSELSKLLNDIFSADVLRIVVSNRRGGAKYQKTAVTKKLLAGKEEYQFEHATETQVFHENLQASEAKQRILELLTTDYRQIDAWCEGVQYSAKLSKKEKLLIHKTAAKQQIKAAEGHNREKQYLLKEGENIPALVALGVFTPDGRVVKAMYHKYRQINRFLEMVDDVAGSRTGSIRVIDFGCGKSYLTFILYHYLVNIRKLDASIVGLDLKADVIAKCNRAAKEYGYTGLRFEVGDIGGYTPAEKPDMVVSLHACDTATDHALYNAVKWGTEVILSVPCCQHELNGQIESQRLSALTKYGVLKERFSALATDALRGCLLEAYGYKTQLLEFVDLEHSPKNILIRAVKANVSKEKRLAAKEETKRLIDEFEFAPTLYRLLDEDSVIQEMD